MTPGATPTAAPFGDPGPPPPPAPKPTAPVLSVKGLKLTSQGISLTATCSVACRPAVVVKLGKKVIARATGRGGAVKVKFSAAARKQLRKTKLRR